MNDRDRQAGAAWGALIGDAVAMPGHWYYDRAALRRDYGELRGFVAPRNPHPDSILWRSEYTALNERGEILHDQARYWGHRGVHYHQFLAAGENTLNFQLTRLLVESLRAEGNYDADDYLARYVDFMLTPGSHRDTYAEEYHRKFFAAHARGKKPRKCAGTDVHIGGLAHVGVLAAYFGSDEAGARAAVREHIELTHRSDDVVRAGDALTRMLVSVFGGGDLRAAILEFGSDWISGRKTEAWSREPDDLVIGRRLSPACYIDDAFPAALYLAWKYAADFEDGVVANAMVGGDNCHRAGVLGALLGAAAGAEGIPPRFRDGLVAREWVGASTRNDFGRKKAQESGKDSV